jgi:hypothetical protein
MQFRTGIINSTTALISSGVTLNLGFIPDKFEIYDLSILNQAVITNGASAYSYWLKGMPNASAMLQIFTAGVGPTSYVTTNGITPVILGGDWYNTIYTITGITNANPGVVTLSSLTPANGQTLVNGMTVTISGVKGMTGLNTNRFIVTGISGSTFILYDTFGNPVDTTGLGTYVSGGQLDMISYPPTAPVLDAVTGQVITPGQPAGNQYDIGYEGLTLGSAVLGNNGDKLRWFAYYATPTGW